MSIKFNKINDYDNLYKKIKRYVSVTAVIKMDHI